MNSKKLMILFLFLLAGCGVKGDPTAPASSNPPSVLDDYPDIQTEQPLNDFKSKR